MNTIKYVYNKDQELVGARCGNIVVERVSTSPFGSAWRANTGKTVSAPHSLAKVAIASLTCA